MVGDETCYYWLSWLCDDALMLQKIHELIDVHAQHAIVSGGAKGAGSLAKYFADEYDL